MVDIPYIDRYVSPHVLYVNQRLHTEIEIMLVVFNAKEALLYIDVLKQIHTH